MVVNKPYNIFHAYGWRLEDIKKSIESGMFDEKANIIQITPMTGIKQEVNNLENDYWIYYQPTDICIGNQLGSIVDLINLTKVAHEHGIAIIADLVLRHVAGADDGSYNPHKKVMSELKPLVSYVAPKGDNPYDRHQVIYGSWGMPMIDYLNPKSIELYKSLIRDYIECGVDGFRIDMGKHFALPSENPKAKDFWNIFKNKGIVYAECIDCSRELLDKYVDECNILPLTNYTMPSNRDMGITFFESHDSYYYFKYTRKLSAETRANEWKLLEGTNRIWFARPNDDYAWELANK